MNNLRFIDAFNGSHASRLQSGPFSVSANSSVPDDIEIKGRANSTVNARSEAKIGDLKNTSKPVFPKGVRLEEKQAETRAGEIRNRLLEDKEVRLPQEDKALPAHITLESMVRDQLLKCLPVSEHKFVKERFNDGRSQGEMRKALTDLKERVADLKDSKNIDTINIEGATNPQERQDKLDRALEYAADLEHLSNQNRFNQVTDEEAKELNKILKKDTPHPEKKEIDFSKLGLVNTEIKASYDEDGHVTITFPPGISQKPGGRQDIRTAIETDRLRQFARGDYDTPMFVGGSKGPNEKDPLPDDQNMILEEAIRMGVMVKFDETVERGTGLMLGDHQTLGLLVCAERNNNNNGASATPDGVFNKGAIISHTNVYLSALARKEGSLGEQILDAKLRRTFEKSERILLTKCTSGRTFLGMLDVMKSREGQPQYFIAEPNKGGVGTYYRLVSKEEADAQRAHNDQATKRSDRKEVYEIPPKKARDMLVTLNQADKQVRNVLQKGMTVGEKNKKINPLAMMCEEAYYAEKQAAEKVGKPGQLAGGEALRKIYEIAREGDVPTPEKTRTQKTFKKDSLPEIIVKGLNAEQLAALVGVYKGQFDRQMEIMGQVQSGTLDWQNQSHFASGAKVMAQQDPLQLQAMYLNKDQEGFNEAHKKTAERIETLAMKDEGTRNLDMDRFFKTTEQKNVNGKLVTESKPRAFDEKKKMFFDGVYDKSKSVTVEEKKLNYKLKVEVFERQFLRVQPREPVPDKPDEKLSEEEKARKALSTGEGEVDVKEINKEYKRLFDAGSPLVAGLNKADGAPVTSGEEARAVLHREFNNRLANEAYNATLADEKTKNLDVQSLEFKTAFETRLCAAVGVRDELPAPQAQAVVVRAEKKEDQEAEEKEEKQVEAEDPRKAAIVDAMGGGDSGRSALDDIMKQFGKRKDEDAEKRKQEQEQKKEKEAKENKEQEQDNRPGPNGL